jgi:uncharacterized membrane protein YecN with MAPEG domain
MTITAFYGSLLGFVFLFLSARVVAWRRQQRIEIGDGEDRQLLRRMRVHGNFAEYVPFALLLMALAESMSPPRPFLHLTGVVLLLGRLLHAYGLSQTPQIASFRLWGMMLTFVAIALAAVMCFAMSSLFLIV